MSEFNVSPELVVVAAVSILCMLLNYRLASKLGQAAIDANEPVEWDGDERNYRRYTIEERGDHFSDDEEDEE